MKKTFLALALLMGPSIYAPAVMASDFVFVRHGDPDRIFKRDEALMIELPPNLSAGELGSLFLELDGIDVTQRITLEGTRAVFYPASPYTAGTHALRLVRLGKNGKLVEIERWNFNVVGGEPPVESQSSVAGTLDAVYSARLWDNYDQDATEPNIQNLAAQGTIDAAMQSGDWRLSLRGNGFANTDSDFNPSRDPVEVGEYLLRAENAGQVMATALNLGSHDIGASNLLMDQFYRRGFSGALDFRQGRARFAGFSQNPAPATGNRNFFGLSSGGQLATGVHTTVQPFKQLGERLELEATAYRGEGTTGGTGIAAIDTVADKGDGYQLGFKTHLVPDVLGMRAQYARADFRNGLNTGFDDHRDEAYNVVFNFSPLRTRTDDVGRLIQWELQPGYYQAGSYFQTLLNPSAESDRQIWNIRNALVYGNFSLDGEVSYIRDNVNNIDWRPHDRSLQIWAQGSYAPEREMWGRPVFMFGGAFSDDERIRDAVIGTAGAWLDRQMWSVNGGAVLSFEKTTWTINHTYTVQYDDIDTLAEYGMHYTDIGLEYRVNDRLTLRPGLQTEFLREDIDGPSTAVHGSLGVQAIIIPDILWNTSSLSALLNEGDTPAGRTFSAETEFNWMLKPAERNSAGYALAFSGMYDNVTDTDDTTDPEDEDLRFFVRLKLSLPYAVP